MSFLRSLFLQCAYKLKTICNSCMNSGKQELTMIHREEGASTTTTSPVCGQNHASIYIPPQKKSVKLRPCLKNRWLRRSWGRPSSNERDSNNQAKNKKIIAAITFIVLCTITQLILCQQIILPLLTEPSLTLSS